MAWVGFAEGIPLTTWTALTTPGAHRGNPEAALLPKTTLGLTLPFPAALPFTVVGRRLSGLVPLQLCLLPIPWARSEAGQEPPRPLGLGSRLHLHLQPLLHHPPPLQPNSSPRPLSSKAGNLRLPLTTHWFLRVAMQSGGKGLSLFIPFNIL